MPKLLDLFSGAGGAAMGYFRAGFDEIVGVDIKPQKNYPFRFVQADALEYLREHGREFNAIHASPPCQFYSEATPIECRKNHHDLIKKTRDFLLAINKPFVIENVENARRHLHEPIKLCGSQFGLPIQRHRYFEVSTNPFMLLPPCKHGFGKVEATINGEKCRVSIPVLCTGGGDGKRASRKNHRPRQPVREIRWAMQIDWMTQAELTEAIPPAYTKFIGEILLEHLKS